MANVVLTLSIDNASPVVSSYTRFDGVQELTMRIGGSCAFLLPNEGRELARQLVAMCDQIEAEKIANEH